MNDSNRNGSIDVEYAVLTLKDLKSLIQSSESSNEPREKTEKNNKASDDSRQSGVFQHLVSLSDACKILNVSETTLWRWDRAKYLVKLYIGGRVFYRKEDVYNIRRNE